MDSDGRDTLYAHMSRIHVIDGGDHSFKVARAGAERQAAIEDDVRRTVVDWMRAIMDAV